MGLMSAAERTRFMAHLNGTFIGCLVCKGTDVAIEEVVLMPILERAIPKGVVPGSSGQTAIPLVCHKCKHIMLFDAADFTSLQ
jgi:hypothetical protein